MEEDKAEKLAAVEARTRLNMDALAQISRERIAVEVLTEQDARELMLLRHGIDVTVGVHTIKGRTGIVSVQVSRDSYGTLMLWGRVNDGRGIETWTEDDLLTLQTAQDRADALVGRLCAGEQTPALKAAVVTYVDHGQGGWIDRLHDLMFRSPLGWDHFADWREEIRAIERPN